MTHVTSGAWGKTPILTLVPLTLILQSTNFIFAWTNLEFRSRFTVNYDFVVGDNVHYFGIAKNLLLGNGYVDSSAEIMSVKPGIPTYIRTPGIPLLYAIPLLIFCRDTAYEVADSNIREVWLFLYAVHLIFLCLGAVYFYKLCALFFDSPWLPFLGGLTYVVWPSHLVFLSPSLAKFTAEIVVAPLLVCAFYLLLSRKGGLGNQLLGGVILGYCLLARVYLVLLPLALLAGCFLLDNPVLKRNIRIVTVLAFLVFLPWPIRNYVVFHDFALSSQGGILLWFGNNAEARGSIDGRMYDEGFSNPEKFPLLKQLEQKYPGIVQMKSYDETQAKEILRKEAIDWMANNLSALSRLWIRKLAITFYPANFGTGTKVNVITAFVFMMFSLGLLLYLYKYLKGQAPPEFLLFALPIGCLSLVTLVFFAAYRTRLLMEPFMILFALYGIVELVQCRVLNRKPVETTK